MALLSIGGIILSSGIAISLNKYVRKFSFILIIIGIGIIGLSKMI